MNAAAQCWGGRPLLRSSKIVLTDEDVRDRIDRRGIRPWPNAA